MGRPRKATQLERHPAPEKTERWENLYKQRQPQPQQQNPHAQAPQGDSVEEGHRQKSKQIKGRPKRGPRANTGKKASRAKAGPRGAREQKSDARYRRRSTAMYTIKPSTAAGTRTYATAPADTNRRQIHVRNSRTRTRGSRKATCKATARKRGTKQKGQAEPRQAQERSASKKVKKGGARYRRSSTAMYTISPSTAAGKRTYAAAPADTKRRQV